MPLIQDFFGLETFLHQNSGAIEFLLRQEQLGFLLGDVGVCFVDGAACLADLSFAISSARHRRSRVSMRATTWPALTRSPSSARISAMRAGVFGVDVDFVRFEPAIAETDAGRQWRVETLPPIICAAAGAAS